MKEIYLLLFALFMGANLNAQFPEGFESGVPPAGWATYIGTNGEGTAQNWTTSSTANTGTQAAFVRYENVANEAEDWLVTPQFTPTAPNTILSFYQQQAFTTNWGSIYTIRVSTASQTTHGDFTIVDSQVETDFSLVYSQHTVDLSAYVGTPIYVAFVLTNDDGDSWYVDDVDMIAAVVAPGCAGNPTPADDAIDVTISGGDVAISWDAPTSGDPVTLYEIFWGTSSGALSSIGTVTGTSATITNNNNSTEYFWMVVPENGGGTASGCPEWSLTTEDVPPIPSNNLCGNAFEIIGGTASGTTVSATSDDYPGTCGIVNSSNAPGVWYTYTSNGPEQVTIDVCGAPYDSQLSVWSGACGSLSCVGGEDDSDICDMAGNTNDASVTFVNSETSLAPVVFRIYVYGWGTETGTFTVTVSAAPLPVELISFNGETMDKGNKLTWSTASEQGTDYHSVERSIDGQSNWTEIGRVDAMGESDFTQEYSFMDERPLGKGYYRLNSVDLDRSYSTSEVVSLERKSDGYGITNTFPNPTHDNVTVLYNSERNAELTIKVVDLSGKLVFAQQTTAVDGVNTIELQTQNLPAGTYFMELNNGIELLTERIIKQ